MYAKSGHLSTEGHIRTRADGLVHLLALQISVSNSTFFPCGAPTGTVTAIGEWTTDELSCPDCIAAAHLPRDKATWGAACPVCCPQEYAKYTARDAAEAQLRTALDAHGTTKKAAEDAEQARDEAVRAALAAGISAVQVANISGMSRERVYQIRDGRRARRPTPASPASPAARSRRRC